MANNALSNGRIQRSTVLQRLATNRSRRVPEIQAIECNNWLLQRYYTRHEFQVCKSLIEKELAKSNGYNEFAYYLKGLILRREGKIQDSLDSFQTAYNINSTNVDNVKQIAKTLCIMGSYKRAVEAYLEAEKTCHVPEWEIHYSLGECYVRLGQMQEAMKHFRWSMDLTKIELPYLGVVSILLSEHSFEGAISIYETILRNNPENTDVAAELGLLYLKIGNRKEAFQQFGGALTLSSNCTKALLGMGYIMQTHREYDIALSKYKIAAQLTSESVEIWNNIGMCFHGKQKYVAAIGCLKKAHYLNPMALLPACNLGIVFLATGQPASAAIYLCAAVAAGPKEAMPYMLLGLALKRLGDLEGADRALTRAHALCPQDPLILINYAIILDVRGKKAEAIEVLMALSDIIAVFDIDVQGAKYVIANVSEMRINQRNRKYVSTRGEPSAQQVADTFDNNRSSAIIFAHVVAEAAKKLSTKFQLENLLTQEERVSNSDEISNLCE